MSLWGRQQAAFEVQAVDRAGRLSSWSVRAALVAGGLVVVLTLWRLWLLGQGGALLDPYKLPLFWLDYNGGVVRRALPGAVLGLFPASMLSYRSVAVVAVLLSFSAAVLLVALARVLTRRVQPVRRPLVWVLVLAAPFALPLLMRDLGRFDAVGVWAGAVLVATANARRYRWSWCVAACVVLAVAAASEEYLPLFLLPLVVVSAWRVVGSGRTRVAVVAAAMMTPALVVSAVSVVAAPPLAHLASRVIEAQRAGVPASQRVGHDAVTVLGATPAQQLADYGRHSPWLLLALAVALGSTFAGLSWSTWRLVGSPRPIIVSWAAAWLVAAVAALSLVGVDFLRWWAFAYLALLAVVAILEDEGRGVEEDSRALPLSRASLLLTLGLLVLAQGAPIGALD